MKNTNKITQKLIIFFLLIGFYCFPLFVQAAGLVPCGGPSEPECNICHLLQLAQNVVYFAIEIAFLIIVILIVYGGFLWIFSAGKEENIRTGQKTIYNAIMGLIIILAAWVIVNTIFWFLINFTGELDPEYYTGTWWKIECEEVKPQSPQPPQSSQPPSFSSSDPDSNLPPTPSLEEQIQSRKTEIEQKYWDVASYGKWAEESIYCYDYMEADCKQSFGTAYCEPNYYLKEGFCFALDSTTEILQSESTKTGWTCTFENTATKQPQGKAFVYCIPSYIH